MVDKVFSYVWVNFTLNLKNIFNKIYEILEQTLKRLEFL